MKTPMASFAVLKKSLAAAVFALAAIALASASGAKPSSGIIINHAQKVNKIGVSCEVCHSPSKKDARLMSFPDMDTCATCHAKETDMAAGTDGCGQCHTNADYSSTVRKDKVLMPTISFDHTKHIAAKVSCTSCHTIFNKVGVTGDEMLPKMPTCVACHTKEKVSIDCATCHTNTAIGSTRPASHTPLWSKSHGRALSKKTIDQTCNVCHTAAAGNDCASCHQREAPTNHNQAWSRSSHGLAAKTNRNQCSTCHTEDQCITCHTTEPPASHTASWGSPLQKHCTTCHIQDFAASGYSSSKIGSNCAVCHTSPAVLASHQSVHRPSSGYYSHLQPDYVGMACATCHSSSSSGLARVQHPYPTSSGIANTTQCASCHPIP